MYVTVSSPDDYLWLVDVYIKNLQFSYNKSFETVEAATEFGKEVAAENGWEFIEYDGSLNSSAEPKSEDSR